MLGRVTTVLGRDSLVLRVLVLERVLPVTPDLMESAGVPGELGGNSPNLCEEGLCVWLVPGRDEGFCPGAGDAAAFLSLSEDREEPDPEEYAESTIGELGFSRPPRTESFLRRLLGVLTDEGFGDRGGT